MAMKRCPVCGEKYSDTYKRCPFCAEEAALRDGGAGRRKGGHRVSQKGPSMLSPVLILVILLLAGLLIYLLFGDAIKDKLGGDTSQPGGSASQSASISAQEPVISSSSGAASSVQPEPELNYETASALPDGLSLSTEDFSLFAVGENHTITVSGGSGGYRWFSQDEGVASVDESGKVTAVSKGTVNVVVTDGSRKGVCIVRCNLRDSTAPSTVPSEPSNTGTSNGSALKAGAAIVVDAGGGVFVRSGPGTSYEALATVSNGADIQIVESAGDGWYKITFSGVGGTTTSGYMKGDYLANT